MTHESIFLGGFVLVTFLVVILAFLYQLEVRQHIETKADLAGTKGTLESRERQVENLRASEKRDSEFRSTQITDLLERSNKLEELEHEYEDTEWPPPHWPKLFQYIDPATFEVRTKLCLK